MGPKPASPSTATRWDDGVQAVGHLLRMGSGAYKKGTMVTTAESLSTVIQEKGVTSRKLHPMEILERGGGLDFISSPEEQQFCTLYPAF